MAINIHNVTIPGLVDANGWLNINQKVTTITGTYISDHTELTSLDYASSGHTGFASSADLATVSGMVADLDLTYATDADLTAVSGSLQGQIDGLTLDHDNLNNLDYASSGHTGFASSDDLTTTSGYFQSLHDNLDMNYATDAQLTAVSGSLQTQIDLAVSLDTFLELTDTPSSYDSGKYLTSTASGITYTSLEQGQEGRMFIPIASNTVSIDFSTPMSSDEYPITLGLENRDDETPAHYGYTVTAATVSGFTVELSGPVATANYVLNWRTGTIVAAGGSYEGTLNHSELNNLDYAGSGHTGFAPTSHTHTESQITDLDKYTRAEVDLMIATVSGGGTPVSGTVTFNALADTPGSYAGSGGYFVKVKATEDELEYVDSSTTLSDDTTPELGGDLSINGNSLDYGTILTVNGTYTGEIMTVTVDDASTVFGNVLYAAPDFHYERANASNVSTASVYVLALESGSGSKKVLLRGQVCNTSWSWTAGDVYLNTITGGMTQVKPSGSGQQVTICGWALSATTIFFAPNLMQIEV